jgi:hypothetical protein
MTDQKDLLIYGKVNNQIPNIIDKRNGISYLQGNPIFNSFRLGQLFGII